MLIDYYQKRATLVARSRQFSSIALVADEATPEMSISHNASGVAKVKSLMYYNTTDTQGRLSSADKDLNSE